MEERHENSEAKAKRQLRNHPKRKGTRRWHHRGFDGCATCRKRHVKCDERQPTCIKCEVLSLECGGYVRPLVFKVFGAPTEDITGADQRTVVNMHEHNGIAVQQVTGRTIRHHNTSHWQSTMSSPIPNLLCLESRYYSHFLGTVSTILIVFDTPYNSNPYRLSFPQLAESSWSLTESMKALGALHLANTTAGQDSKHHLRYAVSIYGNIMHKLRSDSITPSPPQLSDLATNLLLCVFEMMDSQSNGWRVHLLGASRIYETLLCPEIATSSSPLHPNEIDYEIRSPIKHFLVSLLAYLDVAGACSTGKEPLVSGDYWETHGGGWEYNLGVPSISSSSLDINGTLGHIRQSWSRLMSILVDISAFAERKANGMSKSIQQRAFRDLEARLLAWRLNLPVCFEESNDFQGSSPDEEQSYLVEATAFVEAYEQATIIYLHKIALAGRPRTESETFYIEAAVQRVLVLADKFCIGIAQLGMPWALFIAGTEIVSEARRDFVREKFIDMRRFGMKNVQRALDVLEAIWLQKRSGVADQTMNDDNFRPSALLP